MKKNIIIAIMALVLPNTISAQDDMYFVPTKANVKKSSEKYGMPKDTYYCGSSRDVDEYNRRLKSKVEIISNDSAANDTTAYDVISFEAVKGKYPDSLATVTAEDYKCTRSLSRWDDYDCRNAYWHGYNDGRFNRWYGWSTFYDPWYYSSWYGWYDPWMYNSWYGGWYGWYDPWYYGYGWGGYYHPIYVGVGGGSHRYSERERFVNTRFDRASINTVGRDIARRDRNNTINRNISRSADRSLRSNNNYDQRSYNGVRSNDNRQNSFSNSSSFGNRNSGSFSSGSSRSFSSGGGIRSTGGGVRMGGRR